MSSFYYTQVAIVLMSVCVSNAESFKPQEILSRLQDREDIFAQYSKSDPNGLPAELEQEFLWNKKGDMQKVTIEYLTVPDTLQTIVLRTDPNHGELKGVLATGKIEIAFNGENTMLFRPSAKQGTIVSGSELFFLTPSPVHWLAPVLKGKFLSDYLKKNAALLSYAGQATVDEQRVHLLEFSSDEWIGALSLHDEMYGCLKKIDMISKNEDPRRGCKIRVQYLYDDYKRHENIFWPTKVVRLIYDVFPGKEICSMKEIFTTVSLSMNVPLSDADILIQFPEGTYINDRRGFK